MTLTSASSNRWIHRQRAEVDAIGVGSGTILADDPWLTARGAYRYRPLTRVVFDGRLRIPVAARLLSTLADGPVIIVTTDAAVRAAPERASALNARGATIEALASNDLAAALRRLGDLGVTSLLLEGGPALHAAAWRAGVVDCAQLWVTPARAGPDGRPWLDPSVFAIAALDDLRVYVMGRDAMIEGYVHRAD